MTDLAAVAAANLEGAFESVVPIVGDPRGASRRFGGALAVATGLTPPFYNPVLAVSRPVEAADARAAIEWCRAREIEPSTWVRLENEPPLRSVLAELSLLRDGHPTPVMALRPIPVTIEAGPTELTIRLVEDDVTLEDWHNAAISGPSIRRYKTIEFARRPEARLVVGYVDGIPVTGGCACGGGGAVGVYAVGTIESARRRGYARAITWATIEAGRRAWNVDTAILQASEMGEPLYREMGFVEVTRYAYYEAPS